MKQTKIRQWGNSLAIRIPATLIQELGLREGNTIIIDREHKDIIIKRASKKTTCHAAAWRQFLIPTKKKKLQPISRTINRILYGAHR